MALQVLEEHKRTRLRDKTIYIYLCDAENEILRQKASGELSSSFLREGGREGGREGVNSL